MCCLFEAGLYSFRRVPVACISNEQLSVAPESVAEAYLIGLSSRSSQLSARWKSEHYLQPHTTRRRLELGALSLQLPPGLTGAAPGFSFSYVTMYNSSKAILGIKTANCRFPSGPATQNPGLERALVVLPVGWFFWFVCSRGRWSTPQTHKAVNWRLFHVSRLVLGVRNLLEFSVK